MDRGREEEKGRSRRTGSWAKREEEDYEGIDDSDRWCTMKEWMMNDEWWMINDEW